MLENVTCILLSFLTMFPHLEGASKREAFGKGVAGEFIITENVLKLSTLKEVGCETKEQNLWLHFFSRI